LSVKNCLADIQPKSQPSCRDCQGIFFSEISVFDGSNRMEVSYEYKGIVVVSFVSSIAGTIAPKMLPRCGLPELWMPVSTLAIVLNFGAK
jgi:hypothetical protein